MAAPRVVQTYPADGDVGIPVGATLLIYFDRSVDLQSVLDSVILHGPDFDFRSGPDSTMWIRDDGVTNPYFLSSPGFKGVAPVDVELAYYTLGTTTEVEPAAADTLNSAAEAAANIGHVAKITLREDFNAQLAADTSYTLTIVGDPDNQSIGVQGRTVFTPEEVAVAGDGALVAGGAYTGPATDVLHVKITRAGNLNEAKYKYWYDSVGEAGAITGRLVGSKWRLLEEGVKIRFTGENFLVGDEWQFAVEPIERLAASYKVEFTTNDGSFSTAPDSPSTPASSIPPASVLPGYSDTTGPQLVSMTPTEGSYGNSNVDEIVLVFDRDLDPASITDETLKLFSYPVSGFYEYTEGKKPLKYTYVLDGNVLTIRI